MVKIKAKKLTADERKSLVEKLANISIPLRALKIFKYKYGLEDGIFKSNIVVGKKFKITGEAVRQSNQKVEAILKKK